MAVDRMQVITLKQAVDDFPGMWVAIKDGEVVEARHTPDEVVLALHEREIRGAYVVRMPGEDDDELIGLG
jgi:hypothetical protein